MIVGPFLIFSWKPKLSPFNTLRAGVQYIRTRNSFRLPYQRHSSPTNCAKGLFKPSKDSVTFQGCTRKTIFWLEVATFYEWHHKWSSFWVILAHVTWPKAQLLHQSISLKFSLETMLKSKSLSLWSTF